MTTDILENAIAFAAAEQHEGDLLTVMLQAKTACRTMAAEIKRLRAELTQARKTGGNVTYVDLRNMDETKGTKP